MRGWRPARSACLWVTETCGAGAPRAALAFGGHGNMRGGPAQCEVEVSSRGSAETAMSLCGARTLQRLPLERGRNYAGLAPRAQRLPLERARSYAGLAPRAQRLPLEGTSVRGNLALGGPRVARSELHSERGAPGAGLYKKTLRGSRKRGWGPARSARSIAGVVGWGDPVLRTGGRVCAKPSQSLGTGTT